MEQVVVPFRDPLDCRRIRAFHAALANALVKNKSFPSFSDKINSILVKYEARAHTRLALRIHMQRVAEEYILVEAVRRQQPVNIVLSSYQRLRSLGFRNVETRTSVDLIMARYLAENRRASIARDIIDELITSLRTYAAATRTNIANAKQLRNQIARRRKKP
jgi:hypothetical protein